MSDTNILIHILVHVLCLGMIQVPETGFPEEDPREDFRLDESSQTMHEDDEGEIIDCKVVHGFRWYKLRVTTRAVSTEVRWKLNTWGKACSGSGIREGGGGRGLPCCRRIVGCDCLCDTQRAWEFLSASIFTVRFQSISRRGDGGGRHTWLSPSLFFR